MCTNLASVSCFSVYPDTPDCGFQAQTHDVQMLERFQRHTKQDVDAARKNVLAATAELARVRASEGLVAGQDTGAAFDANVNRQRMSPTPPRTVPVSTTY